MAVSQTLPIYWVVFATRFKTLLQYRAAAVAGVTTQIFWGSVKLMIFGAFYANAVTAPPMSFQEVVVYVWLGQVLLALLPWNIDGDFNEMFRSGSVAYELLRPLDLYVFWYARILAFRTAPTLLRMVPGLIFAMLILPLIGLEEWQLHPPETFIAGFLFFCSMLVTLLLSCTLTIFITGIMFWTIESRGALSLTTGFVAILSGMVIPLPLFPEWLQPFLNWQPFRGLCDVPYRIYSGNIPPDMAIAEIGLQVCWVLVLLVLSYTMFRIARTKLVVQGG